MFNEVPVGDKPFYKFGDWKLYAIHDEASIKGFFGDFRWLSNFEPAKCFYMGILYPSSENAYQAAKVKPYDREKLTECSPAESKKLWKKLDKIEETKEGWEARKEDVMAQILFSKFLLNENLRFKLTETKDRYLEETNHWHDNSWGVCICESCVNNYVAQNNLGKLLMRLRNYWK